MNFDPVRTRYVQGMHVVCVKYMKETLSRVGYAWGLNLIFNIDAIIGTKSEQNSFFKQFEWIKLHFGNVIKKQPENM